MPIVWTKPDGTVRVMTLSPQWLEEHRLPTETVSEAVLRLAAGERNKNVDLADATPMLVASIDMAVNRTQRHQWRVLGQQCVVDHTVPGRPDLKQELRDAVESATTLADLKHVLRLFLQ